MTYLLDYSVKRLTGAQIKAAGFGGAIRYGGIGSTDKWTDAAEYKSIVDAGLTFLAVAEGGENDADGGYSHGADVARAANGFFGKLGYHGVIFFANDKPTVNAANFRAYLDGAASVIGKARVGAYGFGNAMDAAVGHAAAFWQAGRRADVRSFVNFWQDNNTTVTVAGMTCDRNLVLKPLGSASAAEEDDMQLTDKFPENPPPGTFAHMILNIDQLAQRLLTVPQDVWAYDVSKAPGGTTPPSAGHTLLNAQQMINHVDPAVIAGKVDAVAAAVAKVGTVTLKAEDVATVARAVAAALPAALSVSDDDRQAIAETVATVLAQKLEA